MPADGGGTMIAPASYRALFQVPGFARVAIGTTLARLSGQMWEVVIVLFVLARFRSPALAGLTVLMSVMPGLILSPVAGALLDRQGRVRLMTLDYSVTALLTLLIVLLSVTHQLTSWLLLILVTILSISNILGITGARSLFPLMLPPGLWDRANGFDASSYSLVAVIGPAIAGLVIARFGPEAGLVLSGSVAAIAALSLTRVREPVARIAPSQSLIRDALAALTYVLHNRSLRGLAIALFITNLGGGVFTVGIPVLVLHQLHGNAATVGQVFAAFGFAGLFGGLIAGRLNTEGRERLMIAIATVIQAIALVLLAYTTSLGVLFAMALLAGSTGTASNVGVFAIRQRRTRPEWFGRAFAVSMALNFSGMPIGAAISGPVLAQSIETALLLGAGLSLVGALATLVLVPADAERLAAEAPA